MSSELKPMGVGSIFDRTFRLSFGKFKDVFKINLLFFAVILVLTGAIVAYFVLSKSSFDFQSLLDLENMENTKLATTMMAILPAIAGVSLIGFVILLITGTYYSGLMNHLFTQSFMGEKWTLRDSFKKVSGKLGSLLFSILPALGIFIAALIGAVIVIALLTLLLKIVGIVIGYTLLIIVFLYIAIAYSFICPIIIYENLPGGQAVLRSFKLVSYSIWKLIGSYLLEFLLMMVITLLFSFAFGFLTSIFGTGIFASDASLPMIIALCVFCVFYILLELFIIAFYNAFTVSVFFNQKIVKEGFGVENMVQNFVGK
jgi:hypothetical protein